MNSAISITLWNTDAENFPDSFNKSVILLHKAKVTEYADKISLTFLRETSLHENPNIPEVDDLKKWYEKQQESLCLQSVISDEPKEYVRLNEIENQTSTNSISLAAIILNCSGIKSFIKHTTGKEVLKRELTLVDSTETAITLNLWNSEAEHSMYKKGDVLVVQNALIQENQNRHSITHSSHTVFLLNPDIPEKNELIEWFNSVGENIMLNKIISMALANNK